LTAEKFPVYYITISLIPWLILSIASKYSRGKFLIIFCRICPAVCRQVHQHFTRPIFVKKIWCQKVTKPKQNFVFFGAKILYEKCPCTTLMKLTPSGIILHIPYQRCPTLWQESPHLRKLIFLPNDSFSKYPFV